MEQTTNQQSPSGQPLQPVIWAGDRLDLLDQRLLPEEIVYLPLTTAEDVWEGIRHLKVRGAPAIGIAAAYGVYLGVRNVDGDSARVLAEVNRQADYLATSRPTAVNLFWALDRMKAKAETLVGSSEAEDAGTLKAAMLAEAQQIQAEDEETNRLIGEHALTLLQDGIGVLTHCNAGGLATSKYGTALAPLYLAKERGWDVKVFADETRPVLQG
ncbi:MAG: methylthioribose-phosphate isomerase, partial [Paenibacillus sp.]|nr:methylthioribose-phosphate isomerase [Paenibacillus sp.]